MGWVQGATGWIQSGSTLHRAAMGAGRGLGYAKGYYGVGSKLLGGATNMHTAVGAVGGGLYGATLGRDPGQSRFGGFMSGAAGGAALGRYGTRAAMGARGAGIMGRGGLGGRSFGAGRSVFSQMSRDARGSYDLIGRGINKAYNKIKGLSST